MNLTKAFADGISYYFSEQKNSIIWLAKKN